MKGAEYVANVVRAYRLVLDAGPAARQGAVTAAKEQLKGSFGRLPTRGFLPEQHPPTWSIRTCMAPPGGCSAGSKPARRGG